MIEQDYRKLMRKVYIDNLRSVLIVDDDFPTLEELLAEDFELSEAAISKTWLKERQQIRDTIGQFRNLSQPLIVDVTDGSNIPTEVEAGLVTRLHQSDLLILDFYLEKNVHSGTKALRIIRELARSPHFNIVVVNTRENIANAFTDVLISLYAQDPTLKEASKQFLIQATNELNELGVRWAELEQIVKTDAFYIEVRRAKEDEKAQYSASEKFTAFFDKFNGSRIPDNDQVVIFEHLAKEHETSIQSMLNTETVRGLKFSPLTEKNR